MTLSNKCILHLSLCGSHPYEQSSPHLTMTRTENYSFHPDMNTPVANTIPIKFPPVLRTGSYSFDAEILAVLLSINEHPEVISFPYLGASQIAINAEQLWT